MHHPTDMIAHTTAFVTPDLEHWLEQEIAQWVHPMKDQSDDTSHHERTLLPRSYISLLIWMDAHMDGWKSIEQWTADGWKSIERWTADGCTYGWMEEDRERWTAGWVNGWMYVYVCTHCRMDGHRVHKRGQREMDSLLYRQMDRWTDECTEKD